MDKELKYRLRLTLSDPFAKVARNHPGDPSIAPLTQVLRRHEAVLKCQYDAFADYVREAEADGVERYPLYAWTKKTVDDPALPPLIGCFSVPHLAAFLPPASCPVAFQVRFELPPSLASPDTLKVDDSLPTPK
jgi:hypothetical protein